MWSCARFDPSALDDDRAAPTGGRRGGLYDDGNECAGKRGDRRDGNVAPRDPVEVALDEAEGDVARVRQPVQKRLRHPEEALVRDEVAFARRDEAAPDEQAHEAAAR